MRGYGRRTEYFAIGPFIYTLEDDFIYIFLCFWLYEVNRIANNSIVKTKNQKCSQHLTRHSPKMILSSEVRATYGPFPKISAVWVPVAKKLHFFILPPESWPVSSSEFDIFYINKLATVDSKSTKSFSQRV